MTKKDYVAIAQTIYAARCDIAEAALEGKQRNSVDYEIIQQLAEMLQKDNPRFNRQRFLAACGVK